MKMYIKKSIKNFLFPETIIQDNELRLLNFLHGLDFNEKKIKKDKINCFNSNNLFFLELSYNVNEDEIEKKYKSIFQISESKKITMDLKEIDSISASKSLAWGYIYNTIFDFGYKMVNVDDRFSYENTKKAIEEETNFEVNKYTWNNRIIWLNDDKSHRMAAFIYHLFSRNEKYEIEVLMREFSINKKNLNNLDYDFFIMNTDILYKIFYFLHQDNIHENKKIKTLNSVYSDNRILAIDKSITQKYPLLLKSLKNFNNDYILYINSFLQEYSQ